MGLSQYLVRQRNINSHIKKNILINQYIKKLTYNNKIKIKTIHYGINKNYNIIIKLMYIRQIYISKNVYDLYYNTAVVLYHITTQMLLIMKCSESTFSREIRDLV